MSSKLGRAARFCFDIFLFCAVCFVNLALHKWFEPHRRGFFCGDESLSYPYREGSIGLISLAIVTVAIPCTVMMVVEMCKTFDSSPSASSTVANKRKSPNGSGGGCHLCHRFAQCYVHVGYFLFGLALTLLASEVSKYCIGRLRPHFFAVCRPLMADGSSCESAANQGRYIEDYTCSVQPMGNASSAIAAATSSSSSAFAMSQLGKAFPSAHSSMSFYAMFYLAIYLQAVLSTRASKLLKHLLQFIFIMLAWYVSLTRISEYWHHWSDVLAGTVLGCLFALVMALYVADVFGRARFGHSTGGGNSSDSSDRASGIYGRAGGGGGGGGGGKAQVKPVIGQAASGTASASATPVLPVYTFGSTPYLHHPHPQYGHTYHNYGYVP